MESRRGVGDARLCRHVDYSGCLARTDSALFGNSVKRHYRIWNAGCAETNHLRTRCQSSRRKYRQDFLTASRPRIVAPDRRTTQAAKSMPASTWISTPRSPDQTFVTDRKSFADRSPSMPQDERSGTRPRIARAISLRKKRVETVGPESCGGSPRGRRVGVRLRCATRPVPEANNSTTPRRRSVIARRRCNQPTLRPSVAVERAYRLSFRLSRRRTRSVRRRRPDRACLPARPDRSDGRRTASHRRRRLR